MGTTTETEMVVDLLTNKIHADTTQRCNNIFDTHYRTFASGISQPGRSLQLGVSIDF